MAELESVVLVVRTTVAKATGPHGLNSVVLPHPGRDGEPFSEKTDRTNTHKWWPFFSKLSLSLTELGVQP